MTLQVVERLALPSGGVLIRGLALSPDGGFGVAVHNLARFTVPTTQVENGWMNDSALTWINLDQRCLGPTVLLDEPMQGAANPWDVGWSTDGGTIVVTHSGTHEVSLIDARALRSKMSQERPRPNGERRSEQGAGLRAETARSTSDPATAAPSLRKDPMGGPGVINDLTYLRGIRRRVPLGGQGPRAMALTEQMAYVAEYFSDAIRVVDLEAGQEVDSISLGELNTKDSAWRGEQLFHDATLSHQSWQSCASCHPDGRADGLNWDLLNDGLGNPKNTKSLLLSHAAPPAMSLGVRKTAEAAVRSGLRRILFAVRPEAEAQAIDTYLKGLKPRPSPYLAEGGLSEAARRGKRLFEDAVVGCAGCHSGPHFTDGQAYDVGTANPRDRQSRRFDTPSLIEGWRTAPYLHDGSAPDLNAVLTTKITTDAHGMTSRLSLDQLEELRAYLSSL